MITIYGFGLLPCSGAGMGSMFGLSGEGICVERSKAVAHGNPFRKLFSSGPEALGHLSEALRIEDGAELPRPEEDFSSTER